MELSEDPSILLCNQTKSSSLSDQQDSRGQKGGGGLLVEPRPLRGVRLHLDSASGSWQSLSSDTPSFRDKIS